MREDLWDAVGLVGVAASGARVSCFWSEEGPGVEGIEAMV